MPDPQGVLVIGEITDGQLATSSKELLAHGRALADALGEPLGIALLGDNLADLPNEAIAAGADRAYAVTDPLLQTYQVDAYLAALHKLNEEHPPKVIILSKTPVGTEVGPRLAFRLDASLAQDCMEAEIDPSTKQLTATRPVFGGNCMAKVLCEGQPMMIILRGKTTDPLNADASRQGDVIAVSPGLDESIIKNKLIERVEEKEEGIRLEDADIVVGGGRGMGGPEPFENELKELADALGAAQGASRAAVDIGWVPYSYQIGLTGKSISPSMYITVGISGASQHLAGCSGSKVIVAINSDAEANIFKEARYGVTGDWKVVLPAFIQQVKELL